jgi:hypothetical protein
MAENAMQGIMGLDEARAMPGMPPSASMPQIPQITPEQMAAFEQARMELDPRDVAQELLSAGEDIDPGAVQELRRELAGMQLPSELLGAMLAMVEALLAEPGRYAQLRQELITEGVPEDILPAQFDAEYFGALELALEQLDMQNSAGMPSVGSMEPLRFAEGGIVSLKPLAKELQSFGRNGDTMLAHITPQEARMLKRMGGSGTINPVTGLPEFFNPGKIFKSVGKVFKSVGKAVGKVVKGIGKAAQKFAKSTVGKIVIAAALAYFVGPAAASFLGVGSTVGVAAVSGFVGGFGSTMLGGGNLKSALTNGAIGGLAAGAGAGIMGGAEAFQAGSYTGPTTISGQFNKFTEGVGSLLGAEPATQAFPVTGGTSIPGQSLDPLIGAPAAPAMPTAPTLGTTSTTGVPATGGTSIPGQSLDPLIGAPAAPAVPTAPTLGTTSTTGVPATGGGQPPPSFLDQITGGVKNFFTPGAGVDPTKAALAEVAKLPAGTSDAIQKSVFDAALKEATPGVLSKYGPIVGGGLGIMALTGGFNEQPAEELNLMDNYTSGSDLLEQDPDKYGVKLGPVERIYSPPGGDPNYTPYQDFYTSMAQNPYTTRQPTMLAKGGPASPRDFPRRNGPVNGAGTGTSDSIPAMLSDGEFVFTARAVRGAGNGSRRDGAKHMYKMMKQFEGNA